MNLILMALALTIAFPAVAQTAPAAPAATATRPCDKPACTDGKMDHSGHAGHADHARHDVKAGTDPHAGHVMPKAPAAATAAPATDAHHDHQH